MTAELARTLQGLTRTTERRWQRIPELIDYAVRQTAAGTYRLAIAGWGQELPTLCIATPGEARVRLGPLVRVTDIGLEVERRNIAKHGRATTAQVSVANGAHALECVGLALSPQSWQTVRGWLPTLDVSRHDDAASYWWSAGFAALALDEPQRFHIAAGLLPDEPNPFEPGAVFQFNLQGLLRHLAAAIAGRATFEDVRPAWEDFLHCFGDLAHASSVNEGTLLWVGRIVFHRIAGVPLGDVAQAIHDSAWTLAGLDPELDDKGGTRSPVAVRISPLARGSTG